MNDYLRILTHSLSEPNRNKFVTSPASEDGKLCEHMCEFGLMVRDSVPIGQLFGGMAQYSVTDWGMECLTQYGQRK